VGRQCPEGGDCRGGVGEIGTIALIYLVMGEGFVCNDVRRWVGYDIVMVAMEGGLGRS
jgi:hypothetical protein